MVSFTATPPPAADTEHLDTQLRLTLGRSTAGTPAARARTALVRGLALGYEPSTVRSAVLRVAPDAAPALLPQASAHALMAAASAHLSRSPLAPGVGDHADARLAMARRIVGRLAAPVDRERYCWTKGDESKARIGFAIIGQRLLECIEEDGSSAVLVTSTWLAVQMDCTIETSGKVLKLLKEAGWIRHVGTIGLSRRWRLGRLPREVGDVAWVHKASVEALAMGIEGDDLADVIRSVRHPGWAYNPGLGLRAWLRLLYDNLGAKAAEAPFGVRQWGLLKQALVRELPGLGARPLAVLLEDADPVARDVRTEREQQLTEQRTVTMARLAEVRAVRDARAARRRDASALARRLRDDIGAVPWADTARAYVQEWAAEGHAWVAREKPEADLAEILAEFLANDLRGRGHEEAVAARIAAFVAGVEVASATGADSAA